MMSILPMRWTRKSATATLSYVLAVCLPFAGAWINREVPALKEMPFAIYLIAVSVVAALGGFGPMILAVAVSVVSRSLLPIPGLPVPAPPRYDVIRVMVITLAGLIISVARGSRVRTQQRLQNAYGDLQELTDDLVASLASNKCACWTLDLESGTSARWFRGSYPVFGRPFEEVEAMPSLLPLLQPEDQPRLVVLAGQMRTSFDPIVFEYRCAWPNGEVHTLEMRGSRVPGKGIIWRGVTLDISERKLTEMALMRVEKLAAMGRLASTVAHEINNPLESVTNLLYLASGDASLAVGTREYLRMAEQELARLANITRLTLGFVRVNSEPSSVEIATVVDEVLTIFQHRLAARKVRLERQFEPGVRVRMPPHELRQIVTNLIANAADAVRGEQASIVVRLSVATGCAVLLVEDNGEGIAPDDLPRIFDAFFSTKDDVGTGIGLWVSKELAEKNGGSIAVESVRSPEWLEAGVRTRFRLELPAVTGVGSDSR